MIGFCLSPNDNILKNTKLSEELWATVMIILTHSPYVVCVFMRAYPETPKMRTVLPSPRRNCEKCFWII